MPEKDICQDLNNLKARLELIRSQNKGLLAGLNSKNTLKIEFRILGRKYFETNYGLGQKVKLLFRFNREFLTRASVKF